MVYVDTRSRRGERGISRAGSCDARSWIKVAVVFEDGAADAVVAPGMLRICDDDGDDDDDVVVVLSAPPRFIYPSRLTSFFATNNFFQHIDVFPRASQNHNPVSECSNPRASRRNRCGIIMDGSKQSSFNEGAILAKKPTSKHWRLYHPAVPTHDDTRTRERKSNSGPDVIGRKGKGKEKRSSSSSQTTRFLLEQRRKTLAWLNRQTIS